MSNIYFVTKISDLGSHQAVHVADDLHHLTVTILSILPPIPGAEYTDAQVINKLTNKDLWDDSTFYLISQFNPASKQLLPLVKDH